MAYIPPRDLWGAWGHVPLSPSSIIVTIMDTPTLPHYLLPPPNTATEHYNLRSASSHNRLLPTRTGHLTDVNFITRLLYKPIRTLINQSINLYLIIQKPIHTDIQTHACTKQP